METVKVLLVTILVSVGLVNAKLYDFLKVSNFMGRCNLDESRNIGTLSSMVCSKFGLRVWEQINEYDVKGYCAQELACPDGFYISREGSCNYTEIDCNTSLVSAEGQSSMGNCTAEDLIHHIQIDCDNLGNDVRCNPGLWVELLTIPIPSQRPIYLRGATITFRKISNPDYVEFGSEGEIKGTKQYCDMNPQITDCHRETSGPSYKYRSIRSNIEDKLAWFGSCFLIANDARVSRVRVPDDFNNRSRTIKDVEAHCLKDEIIVKTEPRPLLVKICGKIRCQQTHSLSGSVSVKRSRYSQVTDKKMFITISELDSKLSVQRIVPCDIFSYCETLDCDWCWSRLINPTCYSGMQSIIVLILLYIIALLLVILLLCCKLLTYPFRMLWRQVKASTPRSKINKTDDTTDGEELKPLRKPVHGHFKRNSFTFSAVILMITHIPLLVRGEECSATYSLATVGTACTDVDTCDPWSMITLDLDSRMETHCIMFRDGSKLDDILQLRLMDVEEHCDKNHYYWTTDVSYDTDRVIHCPDAAECTQSWCLAVNDSTSVQGLPNYTGVHNTRCMLGDACWIEGCFYCSHSCHVFRNRPVKRSQVVYEVFNCPSLSTSALISYRFGKGSWENTRLVNGQTHVVDGDVVFRLKLAGSLHGQGETYISNGIISVPIGVSPRGYPQPGLVGSLQCSSPGDAADLNCFMAPRTCECNPISDKCECLSPQLAHLFTSDNEKTELIFPDARLSRSVDPFGMAQLSVKSRRKFYAKHVEAASCKLTIVELNGCYSCSRGATISYMCESRVDQQQVMMCSNGAVVPIFCGNSAISHSHVLIEERSVSLVCSTPCDPQNKTVTAKLEANDLYMSESETSNAYLGRLSNFFVESWSDGWLSKVNYICTTIIVVVLMLLLKALAS